MHVLSPLQRVAAGQVVGAIPQIEPLVQGAMGFLSRMRGDSSLHPSKYDEAEPSKAMLKAAAMVQTLIDRPESAAIVGPTNERLRKLEEELCKLREGLLAEEGAEDPDNAKVFSIKEKCIKNLRDRNDTLKSRIQLLDNEIGNDERLAQAEAEAMEVAAVTRAGARKWWVLSKSCEPLSERVRKRQEENSALAQAMVTERHIRVAIAQARVSAADVEQNLLQQELERVLRSMWLAAKKKEQATIETAQLQRDYDETTDGLYHSDFADNEKLDKIAELEETCRVRAAANEDAACFVEATTAALVGGYKERLSELKPKETETHREHVETCAKLYEDLSMRRKNRAVVLEQKRARLASEQREQHLALRREDRPAAERAQAEARKLAAEVGAGELEINELTIELNKLEEGMQLSHAKLEELGAPMPSSVEQMIAAIQLKIVREEQTRISLEIAHARAARDSRLAGLEQHLRMLNQNVAGLLADAGGAAGAGGGALAPAYGRGLAAPALSAWTSIASFFSGAAAE